jgi:hypothetical protein
MPLSADQTAMLELLLDGGQDYSDLAELFGLEESDVRARARAALSAIGGGDPDRKVPLSDYLLGKADPIDRADAVRHLKEDPEDHALAERILAGLGEISPQAELVKLPAAPGGGRFLRKPPGAAPTPAASGGTGEGGFAGSLSSSQKRLIAILGSGAVILIVIVLAVAGVFSGGDSSGDTSTTASALDNATGTDSQGNDFATIPLKAPSGDASGTALIGVATGDQAYVDVSIKNLDPAPKGQVYVIWMLLTKGQGYPLAPINTDKTGTYQNRFPIDSAVLPVVAKVQNVNVSLAKTSEVRAELKKAVKNTSLIIDRIGDTVLDGPVPKSEQTTAAPGSTGDTTAPATSTPDTTTTTPPAASTTSPETTTTTP